MIDKINDVGLNKYIVTIDPDNNISEMNENNKDRFKRRRLRTSEWILRVIYVNDSY